MDPLDEKIVATLKYGRKRQVEIVTLLQEEAADRTIRRHIDDLEERGVIAKDEDGEAFYLPEGQKTLVQPKPFADQEEVNQILFDIEEELGIISSSIEDHFNDDSLIDRIVTWVGTTRSSSIETNEISSSFDNVAKLYEISSDKHYILQNKENMAAFMRIFDHIIDVFEKANQEPGVIRLPDEYFQMFFMSVNNIYQNWYYGKENENFDSEMAKRADRILDIFEDSDPDIHPHLQGLLTQISRDRGQNVYILMVKSGNYDPERLAENAFYAYDMHNEIHELFNDLDQAQTQTDDQQIVSDINKLKERVIRMYTREIQDTTT